MNLQPVVSTMCHRAFDALTVIPSTKVLHKRRLTNQIRHALLQITLWIQPKMVGSTGADPRDVLSGIEEHHTVGRHLDGRQKVRQPSSFILDGLLARLE